MSVDDARRQLARDLTADEAGKLAERLEVGVSRSQALQMIAPNRRVVLSPQLAAAGVGEDRRGLIQVLRAVQEAKAQTRSIDAIWTTPSGLAKTGSLTSSLGQLVAQARESIVCATFNFQRSSAQWEALRIAAARPGLSVRVYVDRDAADKEPAQWKPTTQQVADELAGATVLRSRPMKGKQVRTHAKFFAIDHRTLVVTSANFSKSAEVHNVELGLKIEDPELTTGIENQMRDLEQHVYEVVQRT